MALDPAANFVRGSTDASVSNTATTISVVDASIFPDPSVQGEYNLVLWAADSFPRPDQDPDVEIVRVTARDTTADELTVSRGQEGTVAASHPSGSALQLSPTAKMFSDIATKTKGLSDDGNSLNIDALTLTPVFDVAKSHNANEERSYGVLKGISAGRPVVPTVMLDSDPGNGAAFEIVEVVWNNSNGEMRWQVKETGNAAADARFILWEIGV